MGSVKISLSVKQQERKISEVGEKGEKDQVDPSYLVMLQVLDTGQGISPGFLNRKLYSPFSQENVLLPGNGLGLSIV